MKFTQPAALALLIVLACGGARASETYTYDSNPILGFGGGPGVEFTISFTVPGALADGTYDFFDASALPTGFSYVATDGYLTLSDTADLFGVSGPQLTIAAGKVTTFSFYVQDLSTAANAYWGYRLFYAGRAFGEAGDNAQLVDPLNPSIVGYDYTDASGTGHAPVAGREFGEAPGFWTSTSSVASIPEPAPLALMGAASALLLALSRRRRS